MALRNLRSYFKENNRNDFIQLLNHECIVSEKIQASSFHVQKTMDGFLFYKSGNKQPMNIIDRTIIQHYEKAISYFKNIDDYIADKMPNNWKFGFDYITDNQPIDITYDTIPKNNFILTHIQVLSHKDNTQIKKIIRDPNYLNEWADYLDVERPPVIYDGKLSQEQINKLIEFLETSDSQFNQIFRNGDFAKFSYNLFNPSFTQSALQQDLDKPIDSLIISFKAEDGLKNFKLGQEINKKEKKSISDLNQIIILDMVEYFSNFDLNINLDSTQPDQRYLDLMCEVFNNFIKENSVKYIGLEFDTPEFANDKEEFNINTQFIQNQETLKLLENKTIAEIFRTCLTTFRYYKTKDTSLLTKEIIEQINTIVENIDAQVMKPNSTSNESKNRILSYKDYIEKDRLKNLIKSTVNEGLDVNYVQRGSKPVNIFVGRFQPFTLGHSKVINKLYSQNNHPVVIFLVKSKRRKKGDEFKRPYSEELQMQMLNMLKSDLPIEQVYVINQASIDNLFNKLRRDNYEPVLWGTGSDRLKGYGAQVHKQEYRQDLNVRPDFDTFEIERDNDDISATQVRNAILDDNYDLFTQLTPDAIHSMYNTLKSRLETSMQQTESVKSIMNFSEFIRDK